VSTCDVAIVGAGPYGLAAAAHLRTVKGLDVRVFGEPMAFWRRQMPAGMLLRSPWVASHIADPERALTLDAYRSVSGNRLSVPVPLAGFVEYGQWFQGQVAPDLDRRLVLRVESATHGFRLWLEHGETLKARHVVVAAGIAPFAWRPQQFDGLPASLVSHSSEHGDLGRFTGKQVVVVGGGQSALESAALVREAGADVEVVARAPRIHWLVRSGWLHRVGPVRRLLYAPSDVGPAGMSWVVANPGWFRRLPAKRQHWLESRSTRPAAAAWLLPRLRGVPITTGRAVVSAVPSGEALSIRLDDGTERSVDHALLATGYRVDISRYDFLAREMLEAVRRIDGYPELSGGFESSVAGLHFLGAAAARSFGPLTRFVAGTDYAARMLTRCILANHRLASGGLHPRELPLAQTG
jgi:cation diffusion facilitator CzcD-associated flavoprotein CzcO